MVYLPGLAIVALGGAVLLVGWLRFRSQRDTFEKRLRDHSQTSLKRRVDRG